MSNNTEIANHISEILKEGSIAVLATIIACPAGQIMVGSKIIFLENGERVNSFGDAALDDYVARESTVFLESRDETKVLRMVGRAAAAGALPDMKILFERIEAEPRLVIAGAGHVGASLARLAAFAGFSVTLIDERAEFLERELFASPREQSIDLVVAKDWEQAMRDAVANGRGVSIAIVTRGHKQDEECLRATVNAEPDYVGMIGSKRRTNIVLQRLRDEGTDENKLKRVRAPIGLDIGAVSPEEVALAILAEIVAERRGGTGMPLSTWRRG
ncbi:MAG TPA: XdhC family protein [Pyrinomonadaceae bacterium]|nr:XdhC family protein [Pyrinomonadaceae bacterium]